MTVSWNQELKVPDKIKSIEKNIDMMPVPEDEQGKRRPDIWFIELKKKRDKTGEIIEKSLVCNFVEVTIPWGKTKEFQYIDNTTYKKEDITDDSLLVARKKKVEEYKKIEKEMKKWLNIYEKEIKQKFRVGMIDVKAILLLYQTWKCYKKIHVMIF
jgi:hypothetical protein